MGIILAVHVSADGFLFHIHPSQRVLVLPDIGDGLVGHIAGNSGGDIALEGIQAHVVAHDGNLVLHGLVVIFRDVKAITDQVFHDLIRCGVGFINIVPVIVFQIVDGTVPEDICPKPLQGSALMNELVLSRVV